MRGVVSHHYPLLHFESLELHFQRRLRRERLLFRTDGRMLSKAHTGRVVLTRGTSATHTRLGVFLTQ